MLPYDYFFKHKAMLYYLDDPSLPLKVLKQQLENSLFGKFLHFIYLLL